MGNLSKKLTEYSNSDIYRFHMPGHKGNSKKEYYQKDITEIDDFDNLHHPEGVLEDGMRAAAKLYGSRKTWYLINGSTCGILSAIASVTEPGDRIIMARNSHKSVYNAVYLNRLKVSYVYPENVEEFQINGGIRPENVEKLLEHDKNIKAVYITSPTYEGIVSDVEGIANIAHKYGIPLIVDEAHGTHFGMGEAFPQSALKCGADVVIQSLHKTMNAMTQTALIHTSKNSLVSDMEISKYLGMYQSSSPSYILMESIDTCIEELIESGKQRFGIYEKNLNEFYDGLKILEKIKIVGDNIIGKRGIYDRDIGKIVISTIGTEKNGKWLYDILRNKYKIQPEMASGSYIICMTSYMDTREGLIRLQEALLEIDKDMILSEKKVDIICSKSSIVCEDIYTSMKKNKQIKIKISEAAYRISGEFVYAYPPGIPLVVPGEMITEEIIGIIKFYQSEGLNIQGPEDNECKEIYVLE